MKKTLLWRMSVLAIMVVGFALPSQAASFKVGATELSLGGSVRLDTGWRFSDYGDVNEGRSDIDGTGGISKKTDFFLENPGDSRVFLKADSGKMGAYTEFGLATDGVDTRHIYATYNMGSGNSLLFGQTWSPFAEDSPMQVLYGDDCMQYFGDLYAGRNPQLRFEHSQDNITLTIGLQDAATNFDDDGYSPEDVLPALTLSMRLDADKLTITPSLYLQSYELKALTETGQTSKDVTVSTYILALDAALKLDKNLTLSGELWWGQNVAAAIDVASGARNTDFGMPVFDGDINGQDINDVNSYGGWVQLSAAVKPGTLTCGIGYQNADVENEGEGWESEVSTMGIFANYTYPITKGFSVTPEILYVDYGNAPNEDPFDNGQGNDLGTDLFLGVHFQYDF